MFDWLIPIIASRVTSVQDLANKVWTAITDLKNVLVDLFVHWVWSVIHLMQGVGHLAGGVLAFLGAVRWKLDGILVVWLPQAIARAINTAVSYTDRLIADVRGFVVAEINAAVSFARQLVNALAAWAQAQVASIVDHIGKIVALLNAVARLVAKLLTDPRAMADWIAGNIVQAVFRWIVGNAEAIARWGFSMAIRGAVGAAGLLEQIIVDVFM